MAVGIVLMFALGGRSKGDSDDKPKKSSPFAFLSGAGLGGAKVRPGNLADIARHVAGCSVTPEPSTHALWCTGAQHTIHLIL